MAESKAPSWTVVGQREDFGPNQSGQYVQGVTVSYRTAGGSTGSVFLPAAEYTRERAAVLIGQAAQAMIDIDQLSG